MKRQYQEKVSYYCPICGKTASLRKWLNGEKYLECLHCDCITELKCEPYKAIMKEFSK